VVTRFESYLGLPQSLLRVLEWICGWLLGGSFVLAVASYSPRKKACDFARRADEDVQDQWPEQEVDEGKNKVTMPAEQVDGQEGD